MFDQAAFFRGVFLAQVFHDADQKAAGAAGRVADHPGRFGLHQVDHQA
jgi:hypothetical protein